MMIDDPVYYGELRRHLEPVEKTVSQLVDIIKEMATANADMALALHHLKQDHDRLSASYANMRETNGLWDGS